jgi:hypothetical protein
MAIFNEILSGRYNRALQKIFAIKGSPPVRQLGGEITPSHALNSGVENRFMEQWNRFAVGAIAAAVAAQNSAVQFRNPVTSGVIAVLERAAIFEGVADQIVVTQNTGDAPLAGAVGQRCLDNRAVKGAAQTLGAACQTTVGNNIAVVGGVIFRIFVQANVDYPFLITDENQEITVAPGDVVYFFTGNVNVTLVVNLIWRERALEESEKT